ncbi:MAG TPA: hypothetical protein VFU22_14885 [Roseiflexaceae bacterium]|nr:hypothetical protein [Roseiflexaceae bacterium]
MSDTNDTIEWLMAGDPAIRWQALRDLLDAPEREWQAERQRTAETGWGARLLALQEPNGGWGGGIYSPKWTSATYTLLMLRSIGIPRECAAAQRGARLVLDELLGAGCDAAFRRKLAECDRCIVGMVLQLAVYFGVGDERVEVIVDNLLVEAMPDGGWNCRRHRRPYPHHSSFHTTFNVLDGLREYIELASGARRDEALAAERSAIELMLQHRLYKSDKTGELIHKNFTMLSFPYRWHYDLLRGLEYFARAGAPRDSRAQDAIDVLKQRRLADGRWPVQHKYSGKVFFELETIGRPSRWNTLRALRVLRWWNG